MKRRKPSKASTSTALPTSDRPLLSIGMIVKNEMRCLQGCLEALSTLRKIIPCELVIADTGSSDGTKELAANYADILFDFPWVKDFSAARNAVMDKCSGVWFLTIDADECLDQNISELVDALRSPDSLSYDAMTLILRNYRANGQNISDYSDFTAVRILRMDTGCRYFGAVHESWNFSGSVKMLELKTTVLHHDGYSDNRTPEQKIEKASRNLQLLQQELKKSPDDLMRLVQCIESCGEILPLERSRYIYRGMEILTSCPQKTRDPYAVSLWRHAMLWGSQNSPPEFEQWLTFGQKAYKDMLHTRLDVAFAVATYSFDNKDYERTIQYADIYQHGIKDYNSGNFPIEQAVYATLYKTKSSDIRFMAYLKSMSYAKLGDLQKAFELTLDAKPDFTTMTEEVAKNYLVALGAISTHQGTAQLVADFFAAIATLPKDSPDVQKLLSGCRSVVWSAFEQGEQERYNMFCLVQGDIGRAANMMQSSDPTELSSLATQVENWEAIPTATIAHLILMGAHLPKEFFRQSPQRYGQIAESFALRRPSHLSLQAFMANNQLDDSIFERQFLFELCLCVLSSWGRSEDDAPTTPTAQEKVADTNPEDFSSAFEAFVAAAEGFLPTYYTNDLLCDPQNWSALPVAHHLALLLLDVHKKRLEGDKLGCTRTLRSVLTLSPGLSGVVRLISEELTADNDTATPKTSAHPPELLALADKVRAILTQFPDDHPSVVALRQSDAYKLVAHIIEGS